MIPHFSASSQYCLDRQSPDNNDKKNKKTSTNTMAVVVKICGVKGGNKRT